MTIISTQNDGLTSSLPQLQVPFWPCLTSPAICGAIIQHLPFHYVSAPRHIHSSTAFSTAKDARRWQSLRDSFSNARYRSEGGVSCGTTLTENHSVGCSQLWALDCKVIRQTIHRTIVLLSARSPDLSHLPDILTVCVPSNRMADDKLTAFGCFSLTHLS